jgi:hypothetical protein
MSMKKWLTKKYRAKTLRKGIEAQEEWLRITSGLDPERGLAIDTALQRTEAMGGSFSKWAVARCALRGFCEILFAHSDKPVVVEFGGGSSTMFWSNLLCADGKPLVQFATYEHDKEWHDEFRSRMGADAERFLRYRGLRQTDAAGVEQLFARPTEAGRTWRNVSVSVPEDKARDSRIANAFYAIEPGDLPPDESLDGLVLHGPHGNGRSIAFPLFYQALKPNAVLLIDDFDHYPFIQDAARLFDYTVEKCSNVWPDHWAVLRIMGKRG